MATQILPTVTTANDYTFTTTIGGVDYVFRFKLNSRSGFWTADLSTGDGRVLYEGVKMVLGAALFYLGADPERPPINTLFCLDTTEQGIEPSADDFGDDRVLVFLARS